MVISLLISTGFYNNTREGYNLSYSNSVCFDDYQKSCAPQRDLAGLQQIQLLHYSAFVFMFDGLKLMLSDCFGLSAGPRWAELFSFLLARSLNMLEWSYFWRSWGIWGVHIELLSDCHQEKILRLYSWKEDIIEVKLDKIIEIAMKMNTFCTF